jgi:hypothetical protein
LSLSSLPFQHYFYWSVKDPVFTYMHVYSKFKDLSKMEHKSSPQNCQEHQKQKSLRSCVSHHLKDVTINDTVSCLGSWDREGTLGQK